MPLLSRDELWAWDTAVHHVKATATQQPESWVKPLKHARRVRSQPQSDAKIFLFDSDESQYKPSTRFNPHRSRRRSRQKVKEMTLDVVEYLTTKQADAQNEAVRPLLMYIRG